MHARVSVPEPPHRPTHTYTCLDIHTCTSACACKRTHARTLRYTHARAHTHAAMTDSRGLASPNTDLAPAAALRSSSAFLAASTLRGFSTRRGRPPETGASSDMILQDRTGGQGLIWAWCLTETGEGAVKEGLYGQVGHTRATAKSIPCLQRPCWLW